MSPINEGSLKIAEVAVAKNPDWAKPTAHRGHVVQLFFNVNMAKMHRGLHILAKEYDIDLEKLMPGQYVGFLNRARTKAKLFTAGNLFAYLSLPANQEITMEVLSQIPRMFLSTAEMGYTKALLEALETPIPLTGWEATVRDGEALMPGRRR